MGMKQELTAVFEISRSRDWSDVYVILQGTQLNIHRLKSPSLLSKTRCPTPGRLIRSFTLQHSEVGVASDFKKTPLTPKSPFAHLVPTSARHKLYDTDPHLFEPIREHAIRLRLETEQFLLCAGSQEDMLAWIEALCAAVDISPPLEDRSEPRYRSLPRRSRRQRVLDGSRLGENLENLSNLEIGRRLIAEQEEIIRQLYPHLATSETAPDDAEAGPLPPSQPVDADREEFDAEDVRFPSRRPDSASLSRTPSQEDPEPLSEDSPRDPKEAPIVQPSASQALRYRRRCAPVLMATSPRVSDVVMCNGQRARINTKENVLVVYTSHPPRYDAHNFPKVKRENATAAQPLLLQASPLGVASDASPAPKAVPEPIHIVERPAFPSRVGTEESVASFGYDLAITSSDSGPEGLRPSEPPSPTSLQGLKKSVRREEGREEGLGAVALGASLII